MQRNEGKQTFHKIRNSSEPRFRSFLKENFLKGSSFKEPIKRGKFLSGNSLKVRFLQILIVSILLCLILIFIVIRFSWTIAQRSRVENSLTAALQDIISRVDSEYNEILQVSQNMTPTGLIGEKYDSFLSGSIQYDRINDYSLFANSLNIATFGTENILLSVYFSEKEQDNGSNEIIFSSFPVSEHFEPKGLPVLIRTDEIVFQPVHETYNNILNKDVVSVMRPIVFSNGLEAVIYLEAKTDVLSSLRNKSELEETAYAFLQLDSENRVIYSSSDNFPVGTSVAVDDEGMINQNQYIGVAENSRYGFSYVLLLPFNEYSHQTNQWLIWIFIAVFISFAILAIVTFSQIWLLSRPLKALENGMAYFSDGNFEISEYHFNLKEFDHLFEVFNRMKQQIKSLMDKNQQQMKEKSLLELEKLKYQINPHFLMNALNTVRWMAIAEKAEDISSYVNRLGYILSYSLGKIDYVTTLRTELRALENYLELQQTTYDFDYIMDVEEGDYLDQECARFILQPIAENSVCHNMDEFGHLWVKVWQEAEQIHITLTDDGKGFVLTPENEVENPEESRKNKGIGLRYLKMTLDAVYGERAKLRIESSAGKGTVVKIILPKGDAHVSSADC